MSIQVSDIKVCCWCPGLEICLPGKVILSLFPLELGIPLYFFDSDAGQPGLKLARHAIEWNDQRHANKIIF